MRRLLLCITLFCLGTVAAFSFVDPMYAQNSVPRMTKEDLKSLIGDQNVVVIDVRSMGDWQKDTLMIKGAVREDPVDVASWMDKYPKDKTIVFYCA